MSSIDSKRLDVIKVQEFISMLLPAQSEHDWSDLEEIAKLTALRQEKNGDFYISNFWRGPMLYSLVRAIKPRTILELGTGRGYGAFCMAKAMEDGGIDGKLSTNPIAFAAPRRDNEPILVDMTTSVCAEGKVRVAHNKGESLPEGRIIDHEGAAAIPKRFKHESIVA